MSLTNIGFWQHTCTIATNKKGAIATALATAFAMPYAAAIDIDAGNPDVQMRWDNTIKYSDAFRMKSQSGALTNNINLDDGDRNFNKGLISNRIDSREV